MVHRPGRRRGAVGPAREGGGVADIDPGVAIGEGHRSDGGLPVGAPVLIGGIGDTDVFDLDIEAGTVDAGVIGDIEVGEEPGTRVADGDRGGMGA